MAATTASRASARIESRRKPPDFSSPGPRVRRWPSSRSRAMTASEASRTSSARARVSTPSSALGQRWYSASAASRLTTASPRNSSRSLCGVPALRWVSACCSNDGSANAWPIRSRRMVRAFATTTPRQCLGAVEVAHHVQVVDQRAPDLVGHAHVPAAFAALELHVLRLHVLGVVDVQPAEEQVLDPCRVHVGHARLVGQPLHGRTHRVILLVHREQLHADIGGETEHRQHHQEPHQAETTLLALHCDSPGRAAPYLIDVPIRPGSKLPLQNHPSQFSQIRNALPRRFSSGRKWVWVQNRLSSLLSRLSPMTKYWPSGPDHPPWPAR